MISRFAPAGTKGLGVFALRFFARGEFIFRRRHGRVVTNADVRPLSAEDRRHLCELDFDRSAVLLPPGCFLNHSCDPNALRNGIKVANAEHFPLAGLVQGFCHRKAVGRVFSQSSNSGRGAITR